VSFFERYFEALDGDDPFSSLEMVADDVKFAIFWAKGDDHKGRQLLGGREELKSFVEAGGDMADWGHHITKAAQAEGVEFALGETRTTDGERIGTFLVAAQLDDEGRMSHYLVARTPAIAFPE
jgi:hypothetical protein